MFSTASLLRRLLTLLLATLGPSLALAWRYADKDVDNDIFGVEDFTVKVKSLSKVELRLRAQPYIHLITGSGQRIPRLSIKITEVDTGKKVYKDRKSLCKYAEPSCPLERDKDVDITVPLGHLDLDPSKKYCAEVLVIKDCGAHLATIQKDFDCKDFGNDDDDDGDDDDDDGDDDDGDNK